MEPNLNKHYIPGADGDTYYEDHSMKSESVDIYFRNIEDALLKKIRDYKDGIVFGCVAWLTNERILSALAECNAVQIVVQKEDFLRPDFKTQAQGWKERLRRNYNKLKFPYERHMLRYPVRELSFCNGPDVESVVCMGNHNSEKVPAWPRMHNKFLVFCTIINENDDGAVKYAADSVWTGSFNFTKNSTNSLENAVFIKNNEIAEAYLSEHHFIFGMSERLDWESQWVEPQYRIGS